ncbi:molecular chaperone TorD [Skermanella stibiiresistens SB22]|uniref:Molecular chaperone TorD n=1 Tax=Skermanella stibiiresistens SB22 TaxID=1385369 RepID=W9H555_9PROT|nr:molecular chaperone TorD [Skermanella stibiiresistens SB22]
MDESDLLRAQCYGLLAQLLVAPPSRDVLTRVAGLKGDDTPFGKALSRLAEVASETSVTAAEREHFALFIGVARGELVPYASYYLTGFLNEKPLARLRAEMQGLGIARQDNVSEPEDHIASICEMMAGLILGAFGTPADLATQRRFHDRHLEPWATRFFEDLEKAAAANLYRPVGEIGRLFLAIEAEAFAMTGPPAS